MSCTSDKNIINELLLIKEGQEKKIIDQHKRIVKLLEYNENLIQANRNTYNRNLELGKENDELKDRLKLLEVETEKENEQDIFLSIDKDLYKYLKLFGSNNEIQFNETILKEYLRYKKIKNNLN